MNKIKEIWSGLSKRGKIVAGALGAILILTAPYTLSCFKAFGNSLESLDKPSPYNAFIYLIELSSVKP